jgi:putative transposase
MRCPACGSTAIRERPERTAQGYRRFRCRCGKQFNERSADVLNKAQYPSDVIALVVLWRLRYKLSLRDLAEMFLTAASSSPTRQCGSGKPSSPRL